MIPKQFTMVLVPFLLALASLPAQADEMASLEKAIAALERAPGAAIKVNGQLVPHTAWQRSLVYLKGTKILEEQILLYVIRERIEELCQEELYQAKVKQVMPQVEKQLEEEEKQFLAENPGKSWEEHLNAKGSSRADRLLALEKEQVATVQLPGEKETLAARRKKWREVNKEQVEKRIAESIKGFSQKEPDQDFWAFMQRHGYTQEAYREVVRSTLLFQKLFFGGKPWDWPAITKEAIYTKAGAQGKQFFDGIVKQLRDNPKGQVPPMFMGIFQKWVLAALKDWAEIKYASNGLEPEAALSFNGQKFSTAEAYARVKAEISPVEKRQAIQQVVLATALRQALEKEGFYPDAGEFAKAWKEHKEPYKEPFTIQVIAVNFKHYPSMEVYRRRFRLMHGYRMMMEARGLFEEKHLQEFLPEVKNFLGDGKVDVEVIRFSVKDEATGKWRPGGHAAALAQAELVLDALEQGIMTFVEAKKISAWDPMTKHGGTFANKARNELRRDMGEGEYTDFIAGYSVADLIFDKAPEGKVIGPLRGLDAYYLARVTKRHPPAKTVSLDAENMREMVEQEYLVRRFLAWANAVAARTVVE